MKRIIYSHANCLDGAVAAWIWKHWIWPDAKVIYCDYGYVPDFENEAFDIDTEIAVLDFSFEPDVWADMTAGVGRAVMLDHHDTAIAKYNHHTRVFSADEAVERFLQGDPTIWMTNDHSGAALARLFARAMFPPPLILGIPAWVLNVDDRDRWQWKLDGTKEVCAYLNTVPKTVAGYDDLMHLTSSQLAEMGRAVVGREEMEILEAVERSWLQRINGDLIPIVDCPGSISSEVGHRLAVESGHGYSASFRFVEINGELCLKWSLRSVDGGPHVGKIAEALAPAGHKGGGHHGAAGWTEPANFAGLRNPA